MPTYDYYCSACEAEFEYFQSMKDDPLTKCPECEKSGKVKRLISSGAGIIFKGSGFYETDYKSKSAPKGGESEKSSSGESTKSESKPAKDSSKKASPSTD